jgi:hypothetical protein
MGKPRGAFDDYKTALALDSSLNWVRNIVSFSKAAAACHPLVKHKFGDAEQSHPLNLPLSNRVLSTAQLTMH